MPLMHIVALKFKPDVAADRVAEHFDKDVKLKARMPELVMDWKWSPNVSLGSRADVNRGMNYVVAVTLADEEALKAYLVHPEHVIVGELQAPLLEDKFVVDIHV